MNYYQIKTTLRQIDMQLLNAASLSTTRLGELMMLKITLQADLVKLLEKQIKGAA